MSCGRLTEQLRSEIGIGYDVVNYLRTGDKPPVEDAKGWTGRAGLVFEAGSGLRLRGAVGRKMRAPTMRERFGEDNSRTSRSDHTLHTWMRIVKIAPLDQPPRPIFLASTVPPATRASIPFSTSSTGK